MELQSCVTALTLNTTFKIIKLIYDVSKTIGGSNPLQGGHYYSTYLQYLPYLFWVDQQNIRFTLQILMILQRNGKLIIWPLYVAHKLYWLEHAWRDGL